MESSLNNGSGIAQGFLWRRAKVDAQLFAAIFVGVLIAATVVAGAWIYIRSLERVGVSGAVDKMVNASLALRVENSQMPFNTAAFEESQRVLDEARSDIAHLTRGDGNFLRTPRLLWGPAETGVRDGADPETGAAYPNGILQRMTHLVDNVRFVEGRAPSQIVNREDDFPVVEAMVLASRARELDVNSGSVLEFGSTTREYGRFIVVVTGLFEPLDLSDDYWAGIGEDLIAPPPVSPLLPNPLPLFVRGDAIWELTRDSPVSVGSATWFVYLDHEALSNELRADLINGVNRFEDVVEKRIPRARIGTGPRATFRDLDRRAVFSQTPTYLMGALLISVAAYFLYMVSGLLVERRRDDISMLRSRGISTLQIAKLYALELLPTVVVPVIISPFLALLVISQLGRLGSYQTITGGEALPVELSWVPLAAAVATGIATILVLVAPAVIHARTSVIAQKRTAARPSDPPAFQRFFLDFVVLALGGLILWELRTEQTIVVTDAEGAQSTDISALFGPVLILAAAALLFLRVFPLLLRAVTWITGRRAPVWMALGLWKLSRSPYQYAWPILLLVLGSGLGVLAGTLAETLELSARQRIQYATAGDFHVESVTIRGGVDGPAMASLREIDGVDDAALGLKARARMGTTGEGHEYDLFIVDTQGFANVSWFREDFANLPLDRLLASVHVPDRPSPVLLPDEAETVGVWARIDPPAPNLFLWLVLQDVSGNAVTVTLGPLQGPGWNYQFAPIPDRLQRPARVSSVLVFEPAFGDAGTPTTFSFDDIDVTLPGPDGTNLRQLIASFESREDWAPLATSEGLDTVFTLAPEPPGTGMHAGGAVAQLKLGRGTDAGVRGLYRSIVPDAFPIIASGSFLRETGIQAGQTFVSRVFGIFTPLKVVNTVEYFPTLDPEPDGFVIADYSAILDFLESRGEALPNASDQVYFSTNEADLTAMIQGVRSRTEGIARVVDTRTLTALSLVDPLAVAGWRGMAAVALAGTIAIAALGYVVYLGAYLRRGTIESAQLSVLGISRGAYLRMIGVEHVIIGVVGLALGAFVGLIMTDVAVDAVSHTESGGRLLPPFVLRTEWFDVGVLYAVIATIGLLAAVRVFIQFKRLALNQLMRLEE